MRPTKEALSRVLIILSVLLLIALIGIVAALRTPAPAAPPTPDSGALQAYLRPHTLPLMQPLPAASVANAQGNAVRLPPAPGHVTALFFWSSRCPGCRTQMALLHDFFADPAQAEGVRHFYINRTDGAGETLQSAQSYAQEQGFAQDVLYDMGRKVYDVWGFYKLPGTVLLDENGRVRLVYSEEIKTAAQLTALLDYVQAGASTTTLHFVENAFLGEDGGIYSRYGGTDAAVLSESHGLLMEFALLQNNKPLFERSYAYARAHLQQRSGLFSWQYRAGEGASPTNALLDDLRLFRVLTQANTAWGGYDSDLRVLKNALLTHLTRDGFPVAYYDSVTRKNAQTLPLCQADLHALRLMEVSLYENALSVVEGGYIGDDFPLYYSSYNYAKQAYAAENLHITEALLTLYHLSCEGRLREQSLHWLREQVAQGTLAARYRTDGTVPQGYAYPSAAALALAGMIALQAEDAALFTDAVTQMEAFRTNCSGDALNGAFGHPGDDVLHVFDQLVPILLYAKAGM